MAGTPLRILVCEDDERLAALVQETLDADDRFVVVACVSRGDEAIDLTRRLGPDVVLMDIAMPGIDGIAATRAIHERDAAQHVVIYTGSHEYEDVARAEAAGAAGFLHKEALTSPGLPDAIEVLHSNYVSGPSDPDPD